MAKKAHESARTRQLAFPSWYGSHASMVDEEATAKLGEEGKVVCVGENGPYVTFRSRLDNGLADPNRYCSLE